MKQYCGDAIENLYLEQQNQTCIFGNSLTFTPVMSVYYIYCGCLQDDTV